MSRFFFSFHKWKSLYDPPLLFIHFHHLKYSFFSFLSKIHNMYTMWMEIQRTMGQASALIQHPVFT